MVSPARPAIVALAFALASGCSCDERYAPGAREVRLLNVSYDPTRELYGAVNAAFAEEWEATTGQRVTIDQAHGGSGRQARAVIDGLEADVVTLALAYDIDAIAKAGLIHADWASRLPARATPFTSAIVFLVRKGNPAGIRDWADLIRPGVEVITPNPRTSGGARWNYLAAWGHALTAHGGDPVRAQAYVTELFAHVPVLDSGARGATTTFVERGIGDVLLAWESEARLAVEKLGADKVEIVIPSVSIRAEPPVAVVDDVVDRRGTREVATAYLEFLYGPVGQQIAAASFYRPVEGTTERTTGANARGFPPLALFGVEDAFGGWAQAHATHFASGGQFDQLYAD